MATREVDRAMQPAMVRHIDYAMLRASLWEFNRASLTHAIAAACAQNFFDDRTGQHLF
jgi:hypothetical protein